MTTSGWRQAIRSLFSIYTPDVISAIKRPVVVLFGALDRVAPYAEHAEHLIAAAPWVQSRRFDDCGHILKLEAPAKFNSMVRQMAEQDVHRA